MANRIDPLYPANIPKFLFVADTSAPIQQAGSNAPITNGLVILNSASALAMTLAAPRPGPQVEGGDDGSTLHFLVGQTSSATEPVTHTITCPTGSVKGVFTTISLQGIIGETQTLIAWNGLWMMLTGTAAMS